MVRMIFVLVVAAAQGASAATSYYQEGLRLMQAERYQEAVVAFEKEAAESPGSAAVLMNLGWSYWKVNRIDDAWRCFDLLAKLDPKNAGYLRMLAETEIGRKEYPHALEHANQALKLLPGDKDSSIVLSSALVGLRRHAEADSILRGLVARYPDSATVRFHMADNLAAMGRLEESLSHFDAVMRLSPENRDFRRSRANVLYALGRESEAISEWKALAALMPADQKAMINLGWASWKNRDLEAAYKYGDQLLLLDPRNTTYLRFVANVQIERGDQADALRMAQRALEISGRDKDASLIKAKALFNLRRDKEAMAVLTELFKSYPEDQRIVFHMADFMDGMGRKSEALVFFNRLIAGSPDNLVYRHRHARILYDLGDFDKAVAEWKRLVERYPNEVKALEYLADDAVSRESWDEALHYTRELSGRRPLDDAGWSRLVTIYFRLKAYPQAAQAAERAVALNPANQAALFQKAEILETMHDFDGAEKVYHELLQRNPNSLRTLDSLGRIAEAKGDYKRAVRLVRARRKLAFSESGSSTYLDILEARLLADSGMIERGMNVLKKRATRRRISIPVLLYHGVSKFERGDTMSVPRSKFEEQMTAIKRAGYEPITVDQLAKYWERKGTLPDKPILITFDDARADAFANGDPIIESKGMKATMYVHFAGGFKRSRYYAGIDQLQKWAKTGRWEMQAHSANAHESVVVDRLGRKGHYLANRRWLADKRRIETEAEFAARIDGDFKGARDKMQSIFPETPMHSYAFPFGDMGQSDFTNTPDAPTVNWQAVHHYFKFALVQDQHGFNRVPAPHTDMTRWEVKREYSTRDVMRHLTIEEPWVKAKMLEADFWIRTNQPGRALSIYRQLRTRYSVDDGLLYGGEALAFDMFGNHYFARKRWAQALERDPAEYRYRELAGYSAARDTARVGSSGRYFTDNFTHNTKVSVRGSAPLAASRLEGWFGRAYYDNVDGSGGVQRAVANEAGVDGTLFVMPRVRLDADVTARDFYAQRRQTHSANARLTFPFFAPFRLGVKGGVNDVETRMAIARGLSYRRYGGIAQWDIRLNTALEAEYELDRFSDGNTQRLGSALLSRKFGTLWTAGYAFRYGETDHRVVEYYSPRRTATHTGSVAVNGHFGPIDARRNVHRGDGGLRYSMGWGVQDGRQRLINGVKGSLGYRIAGDVSVSGTAEYSQSPAYISRTLGAAVGIDFR
jgi:tetratricopeptide (TPR) repeat protein